MNNLLCIDGGGTKIHYKFFSDDKVIDDTKIMFNANLVANFDNCIQMVEQIIMKFSNYENIKVLIALAGAKSMEEYLTDFLIKIKNFDHVLKCEIIADVFLSAYANLKNTDGLMFVMGTGSAAVIKKGNECKLIGGYGYLFSDECSGFYFGKLLVSYILKYGFENKEVQNKIYNFFNIYDDRKLAHYLMSDLKNKVTLLCEKFIDDDDFEVVTTMFLKDLNEHLKYLEEVSNCEFVHVQGSVTKSTKIRKYLNNIDNVILATEDMVNAVLYYEFE